MSNVGRFDFADGGSYAGALHDGAAEGLGFYVGPDGRGEYSGSWRGGFEESGVYRWSGGESCYEGQWLHGRRHGLGVEQLEGWLYRGEWTQGFKGRYGLRQSTRTGAKYEGSWIVGKQDGYGVETYADGGTYEGQWLRGVRHGYGVRQSVSYDLALRYHQSNALPFTPIPSPDGSPINPHGHDPLLSTRDRRIEQGRAGGFVLVTDLREKDLDKRGRTGLRGTLRLIRQRSTGDIEDPTRLGVRGAPAVGGSVRSTVSTGRGKGRSTSRGGGGSRDEDEEEEWGSFISLVGDTRFREDVVERYWGEWKNDRRSGYGICERSDGVKYEGEWLNNKKNGYGVTTLRDGSRLAGKYRRNVLLSSTSDVKPFLMRTGRLKEQVENATREAEHAARVALDRAQIAQTRTTSARIKADEAHLEAGRAESLAEAARAQAQNNANAVLEPGSQIFMNCLREDDFLSSFGAAVNPDANPLLPLQGHSKTHVASKFLSLFRPKRRSPQQMPVKTIDFETPANHTTARYYSATGNTSLPFRGHDLGNRELMPPVPRINTSSTVSPGSSNEVGGGIRSRDREFGIPQRQGILSSEHTVNHEFFSRPETASAAIAQRQGLAAAVQPDVRTGSLLPRSFDDVVNQSDVFPGFEGAPEAATVTLPTFSRFRDQTGSGDSPQRHRAPPGRRRAHAQIALPTLSPTASTEDGAPIDSQLHFRRKSLPSIIKEPVFPSAKPQPTPANQSTTMTSGRKPDVSVTSGLAPPERETIVIEDGVRKRVTPVYGARSPVRALAVGGRAGLPKLYSMEATTSGSHGRGSVPDLTEAALEGVEVPAREVVYALSQQRREELIRERMEANRRRGGQIILRLGDVKDWCARRKMLIILLAVNYALVSVFYNLLQQQEPEHPQS